MGLVRVLGKIGKFCWALGTNFIGRQEKRLDRHFQLNVRNFEGCLTVHLPHEIM